MKFMDKLRYALSRYLYGRYGVDQFGRFLSFLITILLVISLFWRNVILICITLVLLIILYARVLSKNYEARRKKMSGILK